MLIKSKLNICFMCRKTVVHFLLSCSFMSWFILCYMHSPTPKIWWLSLHLLYRSSSVLLESHDFLKTFFCFWKCSELTFIRQEILANMKIKLLYIYTYDCGDAFVGSEGKGYMWMFLECVCGYRCAWTLTCMHLCMHECVGQPNAYSGSVCVYAAYSESMCGMSASGCF